MFFSLRNNLLKNYRDFELLRRNILLLKKKHIIVKKYSFFRYFKTLFVLF